MPKKLSREELLKEIKNKQWNVYEHKHLEFLLNEFEEDLLPYLDVLIEKLKDFTDSHDLSLELIERIYKENPAEQLSIIEKLIGRFDRNCDYVLFLRITKTLVKFNHPQTFRLFEEYLFGTGLHKDWGIIGLHMVAKHPDEFLSLVPKLLTIPPKELFEDIVRILRDMKNEQAFDMLLDFTKNESYSDFRAHLVSALSNYPTPETVEFLIIEARSGQRFARWAAIDNLGFLQIEEAVPLLSEFYLGDEDDQIKKRALKALIKLSKTSKEADKFLKENYYLGDTL